MNEEMLYPGKEFCKINFKYPGSDKLTECYLCTPNHTLLKVGVGWTKASDLKVNDKVFITGIEATIAKIESFYYKPPEHMLEEVQEAIRDYYYALDTRQHGGVAQDKAFQRIEKIMGMCWTQGEEKQRREEGAEKTAAIYGGNMAEKDVNELVEKFAVALMIADDFLRSTIKSYESEDPPAPLDKIKAAVAEANEFLEIKMTLSNPPRKI